VEVVKAIRVRQRQRCTIGGAVALRGDFAEAVLCRRTAETIYRSFDFTEPWEKVRFEDVWNKARHDTDIRVLATLRTAR